jgi:hypothetical protein
MRHFRREIPVLSRSNPAVLRPNPAVDSLGCQKPLTTRAYAQHTDGAGCYRSDAWRRAGDYPMAPEIPPEIVEFPEFPPVPLGRAGVGQRLEAQLPPRTSCRGRHPAQIRRALTPFFLSRLSGGRSAHRLDHARCSASSIAEIGGGRLTIFREFFSARVWSRPTRSRPPLALDAGAPAGRPPCIFSYFLLSSRLPAGRPRRSGRSGPGRAPGVSQTEGSG